MPSLTSELIVSLIDKVSGPAKGAAAALNGVAKAEKTLASGGAKGVDNLASNLERVAKSAKGLQANWSKGFGDEIAKLGLKSRDIDKLRRSWDDLLRSISAGGTKNMIGALPKLDAWEKSTLASLRRVEREAARVNKTTGSGLGGARFAAGALGVGSGAYVANRGLRGTVKSAAEYEREGGRAYLAGMTPSETVQAQGIARSMSAKYPSLSASQIMERIRSLRSFAGDLNKATRLLEENLQGLTVLQSIKGKDRAMDEMQQLMRGLDVLGKNEDPAYVGRLTNAYIKALGIDPDLNAGQFSQFARKSKAAGASLSEEFLSAIVPTFAQDLGGPELGTALGTEISQIIGGRATKASKAYMQKAGLRDKKGDVVDGDLLKKNPYDWINKYAPDAMRRMKLDPSKEGDILTFASKAFSAQTVANLFTKFITQREQAERNRALQKKAPDMKESSEKLRDKDPFVSAEGFVTQMSNTLGTLADGPMQRVIPLLNAFTDAIGRLNEKLSSNPDVAEKLGFGVIGATALGGGAIATKLLQRYGVIGAGAGGGALFSGGGAIAGGGFMASDLAATIIKNNPEAAKSLLANSMLGAMSGDSALAAAILHAGPTPSFPKMEGIRTRAGSTLRPAEQSIWEKGTKPIEHLDMSSDAAAAGQKTGEAYKNSVTTALAGVDAIIQAAVQRWSAMLSFSATPTITPKVNQPAGQKSSSLDAVSAKQHAAFADYGMKTV